MDAPGTELVGRQPTFGPTTIEGPFDRLLSVPGLLKEIVAAEAEEFDARIIVCFADTGLDAARAWATKPAIGISEASFHSVSLVVRGHHPVTFGAGHRGRYPALWVRQWLPRCVCDRHSGFGTRKSGNRCVRENFSLHPQGMVEGAEGVALGCVGMAEFAADLQRTHEIPVVDGVSAAVGLAKTLVRCRLATYKSGVWAAPTRLTVLENFR